MDPEMERKRFRRQFTNEQWLRLIANEEFKTAWETDNFVKAGEIASPLIMGEVNTVQQVRRRLHKPGDIVFE
jgi:hypothetical protein